MKIILIIIGVLIYTYLLMVISWTNGFMRSLKLMSQRGLKRSKYEKHCIKHAFNGKNVDPFIQSVYYKEETGRQSDYYKKVVAEQKQKVEDKIKEIQNKVAKKAKKNVKKTKK